MSPYLQFTLDLKETIVKMPLPTEVLWKLLMENVMHSPREHDCFEWEAKTTAWGEIWSNKAHAVSKCSLLANPKSYTNMNSKCGGRGKNYQPLTIMHVTVSFRGIQLNSLQEEFFSLTLTTLKKQRKWMIQQ